MLQEMDIDHEESRLPSIGPSQRGECCGVRSAQVFYIVTKVGGSRIRCNGVKVSSNSPFLLKVEASPHTSFFFFFSSLKVCLFYSAVPHLHWLQLDSHTQAQAGQTESNVLSL